jgi:hypothetical protein
MDMERTELQTAQALSDQNASANLLTLLVGAQGLEPWIR